MVSRASDTWTCASSTPLREVFDFVCGSNDVVGQARCVGNGPVFDRRVSESVANKRDAQDEPHHSKNKLES